MFNVGVGFIGNVLQLAFFFVGGRMVAVGGGGGLAVYPDRQTP